MVSIVAGMVLLRNLFFWTLMAGLTVLYILIVLWSWRPNQFIGVSRSSVPNSPITSDMLSNYWISSFPITKELIVFTAHFDNRSRKFHNNITMIFIVASKKMFKKKMIIGCGVGEYTAKAFQVRYVYEDILMHRWLGENRFRYEQLVVECYDLPVTRGDTAFIMYKADSTQMLALHTEQPVGIPKTRVTPEGSHNFSVAVCTKAHNRGVTWLPQFLRYQKTLGVDHVHLSISDKFIKDEGFRDYLSNNNFFVEHLRNNYITLQVWREWYRDEEWYVHGTILMYLDCLYRYRGTYDYVTFMDTDDFFTVRTPGMSYKDVIAQYCTKKTIGSCTFNWLFYYPGLCGFKSEIGDNGNITAAIVPHQSINEQNNFKSIHLSEAVLDSSFHDAKCSSCLMKGYRIVHVPQQVAYVAHHRMYAENKKKKKVCQTHLDKPNLMLDEDYYY